MSTRGRQRKPYTSCCFTPKHRRHSDCAPTAQLYQEKYAERLQGNYLEEAFPARLEEEAGVLDPSPGSNAFFPLGIRRLAHELTCQYSVMARPFPPRMKHQGSSRWWKRRSSASNEAWTSRWCSRFQMFVDASQAGRPMPGVGGCSDML